MLSFFLSIHFLFLFLSSWRLSPWYVLPRVGSAHRYLMSRLSLQVFSLWRHVLSTAAPFILWWSNLEILFAPLHRSSPFIRELRCQAIHTEHGLYTAERTQKAVYTVMWDVYGSASSGDFLLAKLQIYWTKDKLGGREEKWAMLHTLPDLLVTNKCVIQLKWHLQTYHQHFARTEI
jgi:hypothetical protein